MVRRDYIEGDHHEHQIRIVASALALAAFGGTANAQEIARIGGAPGGPFVAITGVPMGGGMTMYFVSGALPTPVTPPANGQPAVWGDTPAPDQVGV